MNERRTNLKEAYKFVRTCRVCKKPYGSDFEKEDQDSSCPECIAKANSSNGSIGALHRYARTLRGKTWGD